jgi:hypothetical protein
METEVSIYSTDKYGYGPQLEALVSQNQLAQCIANGYVKRDRKAGMWVLTPAGERALAETETQS